MNKVKAVAPATVANVSCGFDILGFALDSPADEVIVAKKESSGVTMLKITGDNGRLPMEAERNTSGVAIQAYLNAIGSQQGVTVELTKKLPLGSGMGSSAASSVAALMAINYLMGEPLKRMELLPFAMEAERVACGSAHADNVAPSLLGGFVLVRSYDPLDVVQVPVQAKLFCTLVHPHLEINTKDSRKVLKLTLSLKDAVTQWGNIAGLIVGLSKPDYGLIGRSLHDVVAEPIRSLLIPGFDQIKKTAIDTGALGCGISGSGPTIFALSKDQDTATAVGKQIQYVFSQLGLKSETYISGINPEGAKVVSAD